LQKLGDKLGDSHVPEYHTLSQQKDDFQIAEAGHNPIGERFNLPHGLVDEGKLVSPLSTISIKQDRIFKAAIRSLFQIKPQLGPILILKLQQSSCQSCNDNLRSHRLDLCTIHLNQVL
jgi:hypothetical protein